MTSMNPTINGYMIILIRLINGIKNVTSYKEKGLPEGAFLHFGINHKNLNEKLFT
jgi:hypothetical protein